MTLLLWLIKTTQHNLEPVRSLKNPTNKHRQWPWTRIIACITLGKAHAGTVHGDNTQWLMSCINPNNKTPQSVLGLITLYVLNKQEQRGGSFHSPNTYFQYSMLGRCPKTTLYFPLDLRNSTTPSVQFSHVLSCPYSIISGLRSSFYSQAVNWLNRSWNPTSVAASETKQKRPIKTQYSWYN